MNASQQCVCGGQKTTFRSLYSPSNGLNSDPGSVASGFAH